MSSSRLRRRAKAAEKQAVTPAPKTRPARAPKKAAPADKPKRRVARKTTTKAKKAVSEE